MLYQIGPEFETFTPGAVWSDTRLGTANLARFSKVALVTDIPWMQGAIRVFAPLVPGEVRVFADRELAAAKAWIAEDEAKDGGQSEGGEGGALDRAQPRSRISRAFWRCQSRLASVARLSASFLPLAMPSCSLALPRSLK